MWLRHVPSEESTQDQGKTKPTQDERSELVVGKELRSFKSEYSNFDTTKRGYREYGNQHET